MEGEKVLINFGKYRGKALSYICQVDPEYISWMRENLGMDVAKLLETKQRLTENVVKCLDALQACLC